MRDTAHPDQASSGCPACLGPVRVANRFCTRCGFLCAPRSGDVAAIEYVVRRATGPSCLSCGCPSQTGAAYCGACGRPFTTGGTSGEVVPVILMTEAGECGIACLAMLLTFHGHAAHLADIRADCDIRPDGASLLELATAARLRGFRATAFALAAADLQLMPLPAIAHWNARHFVVVERPLPDGVQIVDPALGRRTMPAEAFAACFSGAMLTLAPGNEVVTAPFPTNALTPTFPHGSSDRPWPDCDRIGMNALNQ